MAATNSKKYNNRKNSGNQKNNRNQNNNRNRKNSRNRKKRQKYIPAYIALYGTIFLVAVLIILLISKLAGGNKEDKKPENTAETTTGITTLENVPADTSEQTNVTTANLPVSSNKEDNWALYVIGNDNPLPADFTVEIKSVAGERTLDKRCADYAIQMMNDAKEQGVGLYITSAYRSIQYQADNLQNYINSLMEQCYTKEEATE
ncbi:MAG: D-alanyl-D-alanine carboxypeptidase family protein, partial [Ruminiclostridium sp.]|nr:D-alanyl-D-alanine carboxypeptidase family protein [Ruminiclostridium sp.]